jgi:sugar/nucleoside kinase (ribokinase family)
MSGLLLVGSVIVDLVMYVAALPVRGGDVLAQRSLFAVGGGHNVLSAAKRQGMRASYAGRHGDGPFGDRVRAALQDTGAELCLAPTRGGDTGYCVALVDRDGERTFATAMGVEGGLTGEELAAISPAGDDVVYLSGYDLVYPHGPVIADWVERLPTYVPLVCDPSPLVASVEPQLLRRVLARATWVSASAEEAAALGSPTDLAGGLVVRTGAAGCVVHAPNADPVSVAAPAVEAVDTSGAGDTHVGAFVAALRRGLTPVEAATWANAAAAISVTREGPATCPDLAATKAVVRAGERR